MSSPDKSTGIGTEQAQCTAAAILDTYGVAGLQKAGYTVAELANPNSDGSRLPATPAQLADLGTRLQRCRLGKFIAPSFASGFQGAVRADTNACLTRHIDTDTSARQVLALAILNHNPDRPAARALVDILANCVDFGTLALSGVKNLTPAQRACIGPKMAKSEAFRDAVVDEILGNKPTTAQILRIALDSVSSCLTPQQLSQLQGGGG